MLKLYARLMIEIGQTLAYITLKLVKRQHIRYKHSNCFQGHIFLYGRNFKIYFDTFKSFIETFA